MSRFNQNHEHILQEYPTDVSHIFVDPWITEGTNTYSEERYNNQV